MPEQRSQAEIWASKSPEAKALLKNVVAEWDSFSLRHGDWLARAREDPLYCLPKAAIARLELPRLGRPPILDPLAAAAEDDLLALCHRHGAVGFLAGKAILYPHLARSTPRSLRADFPGIDLSASPWREYVLHEDMQEARLAAINLRLKGYAGWLVTEPSYLGEVEELEARWRSLPPGDRPGFPMRSHGRRRVLTDEPEASPAPEGIAAYNEGLGAFLGRWGLVELAAWRLPVPQGPLFLAPSSPSAPALPEGGLHIVLPLHYALTHDDDLLHEIRGLQRSLASDRGLDPSLAGLPHFRAYALILEIVHWKRTIDDRYGRGRRPKGFVAHVVEALAEATGREVALVEKWIKAVSACRRGKRSSLRALRVADE